MKTKQLLIFCFFAICCGLGLSAQTTFTAKGLVKDAEGEAIMGATVQIKELPKKTVMTDVNGNFSLAGVSKGQHLSFYFYGYKKVTVEAQDSVTIVLKKDASSNSDLGEVVVTAFGKQKKEAFTGSATVMDTKKIESKQVTNVISALQGEAAGVQMVNNSGDPTSTPEIRIRGFSSISAGNEPLIVVDGAPYDGGWNNLNPADVASINVLKDAASASLYGARGANGIIMITTKKAKEGNTTISLDAKWGIVSRIKRDYETINDVGQYYETYYKALYNYAINANNQNTYEAHQFANSTLGKTSDQGGLGYLVMSVPHGETLIGDNGRLNPHATLGRRIMNSSTGEVYTLMPDNWTDEATRNGSRQEYNININGGNEKAQFYASLGYLNTQGISYGSDFKRYSARLKANYQAKSWLKVGGNIAYANSTSNYLTSSSNNSFYFAQQIAPIYPVYLRDANGNIMTDRNGKMYDYGDGAVTGLSRPYQPQYNPLQDPYLNTYVNKENQFTLNGFADFTPIKNLTLTANGTATLQSRRFHSTFNPFYGYSATAYPDGYINKGSDEYYSLNFQQLANYKFSINNHNVELLLGHENYKKNYDYVYGTKLGMVSYYDNQTLSGAIKVNDTGDNKTDYNNEGYFFRGQYDYMGKYFASASIRRDASSRFHPDNRWGTFYSLGAGWLMEKEAFMKKFRWINSLKPKFSFGQVGNDNISDFLYTDTYNIVNSDGNVAITRKSKGNKDITWETVTSINAGVDYKLFNKRLRGSIEYFYKITTDMLSFVGAPKSSGVPGTYENIGNMVNRGFELEATYDIMKTKALTWSVNFNATFLKNKITKIADKLKSKNTNPQFKAYPGYSNGSYYYGEGLPLYTWYMPKYAGLTEDGRSQWYVAKTENGVTTTTTTTTYGDATYYACGDPNPDAYGGFGTSFSYKGFDLNISFSYSIGGLSYDNGYSYLMTNPTEGSTGMAIHKDMLNAWRADNTSSTIPRWQYNDINSAAFSDRFLTDASSLTLQSINIGYTFEKKLINKIGLSNLRVYLSGENLYYWTARKGFDPRGSFDGDASTSTYSPSRTISIGVTASF